MQSSPLSLLHQNILLSTLFSNTSLYSGLHFLLIHNNGNHSMEDKLLLLFKSAYSATKVWDSYIRADFSGTILINCNEFGYMI